MHELKLVQSYRQTLQAITMLATYFAYYDKRF